MTEIAPPQYHMKVDQAIISAWLREFRNSSYMWWREFLHTKLPENCIFDLKPDAAMDVTLSFHTEVEMIEFKLTHL